MTDVFSKKKRREIMRSVKSRGSKIETDFRKGLWRAGFRYRKNARNYFGKPDAVLKRHKAVVFVDSCFWHGCKKHYRLPATRRNYWAQKILKNKYRDKEVVKYYKKNGWKIFRVWEHELLGKTLFIIRSLRKSAGNKGDR